MRFTSGAFVPLSLMLLLSSPLAGIAKSDAKASARAETRAEKSPPRSDGPQAGASTGIAITVYNQNFGLVKDIRSVDLKEGINNLRFDDVAAAIDPTTVSFTSLTAPNSVVVREQNYQYDLMDVGTILSKSVGKEIKIRQYLSG
ncbi:MAG TPA: hypothetical protein PKN86_19000, partial [Candidatus Obscuribacter sp.]|nr:hypothetical protein [Candidatus Obscuribacter sp.]